MDGRLLSSRSRRASVFGARLLGASVFSARLLGASVCAMILLAGCRSNSNFRETVRNKTDHVDQIVASMDHLVPEVLDSDPANQPVTPASFQSDVPPEYWDMTLDESIRYALANSTVFRDLRGTVLRAPEALVTKYETQLQVSDPRFGIDAALSEFDAEFITNLTFEKNDRDFNNTFFSGGANTLVQDRNEYLFELRKLTATGGQVAMRNFNEYDSNNANNNTFVSAWFAHMELEMRQPLMQGGGLAFNRIAGPNSTPGVYNGVLIARTDADMVQEEFEISVRDFVSNVSNAYWDLYFAYRDLDAKREALERARETWQRFQARAEEQAGGTDENIFRREATAREQYYRALADFREAQSGRLIQRTDVRNGTTGGALRGISGVQVAERRLRLLIGLPISDHRILRPIDEPEMADVSFNWDSLVAEALARRPEIRKQRLQVKKRELELIAAKNFLNPRLDVVGQYRFRGFGDDLLDYHATSRINDNAYQDIFSGAHQEWEIGVEFSVPIGFRQGHAAVQNAEFYIAKERAVLREQEREVIHDLSNVYSEVERAYNAAQTQLNRYLAARDLLLSLESRDEADRARSVDLDKLLDAQRRVAAAESQYFLARAEYAIALKNVHFEKGSLFEYNNIQIFGDVATDETIVNVEEMMPVQTSGEATDETTIPHTMEDTESDEPVIVPLEEAQPEVVPPAPLSNDVTKRTVPVTSQPTASTAEIGVKSISMDDFANMDFENDVLGTPIRQATGVEVLNQQPVRQAYDAYAAPFPAR